MSVSLSFWGDASEGNSKMRRFKSMCKKEDVDAPRLVAVDRYGRLLALLFSTRFGANMFENDFNNIDYDGANSRIWSEIVVKDNKTSAGARIHIPRMCSEAQ